VATAEVPVTTTDSTFEQVYEREYVPLVRLAHLLTGSNEAGEDLVQEAFALALRDWDRLGIPAGYIRTSVINGARSLLRRQGVERRLGNRVASPAVGSDDLGDGLWTCWSRCRSASGLRFYEDRTTGEIAEALGCRPGTARSLISRGTTALREVIQR
jgi:DNA-directed RNA polymerase specialized sigma24 family protein